MYKLKNAHETRFECLSVQATHVLADIQSFEFTIKQYAGRKNRIYGMTGRSISSSNSINKQFLSNKALMLTRG